MSVAKISSSQPTLLSAQTIEIEVDLSKGLHSFSIVGLASKAVDEARDRVSAAIKNTGFKSPKNKNQKIVVSLAPADLKKEGPVFDVPIALGYLLASGDIEGDVENKLFVGELGLNGDVRGIKGILPIVKKAREDGFAEIFVPLENADEAASITGITVYGVLTLRDIIGHINTREWREKDEEHNIPNIPHKKLVPTKKKAGNNHQELPVDVDFADVKGQEVAKRALEIAAAGGHNILLYGPPGTGKTMLARALRHILPPLSFDDSVEVTSIYSVGGLLPESLVTHPPFRSPHHTASYVSLIGGGSTLRPGEVTLAHKGILFLDEFAEFDAKVIETLRQPLEDKIVTVSRAKGSVRYPADFILVATMNPCPCGYFGAKGRECTCTAKAIDSYKKKLSGPIVDRIDLWVEVSTIEHESLTHGRDMYEKTENIRPRVEKARAVQRNRYTTLGLPIHTNGELTAKDLVVHVPLSDSVKHILNTSAKQLDLSARSYHRLIKLARTIADLEGSESITDRHILEALQYRPKKYQVRS